MVNRPPLREPTLRRALLVPGGLWTDLRVVAETGSTNADLAAAARAEAPEGLVLVAESQTGGRGRRDRSWVAPARSGITVSVLLRPRVAATRLAWLPLLAGVALVESIGRIIGGGRAERSGSVVETALKWPNDLLVRSTLASFAPEPNASLASFAKCAGVLAEVVGGGPTPAVVLGIGLNVSQLPEELPEPSDPAAMPPTSLAMVGAACTDRERLLCAMLRALAGRYRRWVAHGGAPAGLRDAYRSYCVTIGKDVTVTLPGGDLVVGRASDVDDDGRLVVTTVAGSRALAAGDVRHVR
jgi:BirA family transcriptional regulator, biotin operon repressor / biotin---[acetyl-CoA-carboxylase] ligase